MGWFSQLLFGDPDQSGQALPKRVEQWQNDDAQRDASIEPSVTAARSTPGQKVIPEVEIERVAPRPSSDMKHLDLWVYIKNHSPLEVELTKITCLRQKIDPNQFLKAGECREIKMYSGDTPRDESERKAIIEYKVVQNGDYFEAEHLIRYTYEESEGSKFYIPEDIDLVRPIHDRY